MIYSMREAEYIKLARSVGLPHHIWGYARAWTDLKDIYVNVEAFYLCKRDYNLLIAHEQGHIDGKEHTWFGLMSAYGLVRFLTTWRLT